MFGIGGQELILLMIIGLVVLGPERLPRIANQVGGWLGQARRMTRVMKRQLEEELDLNKSPTIKPPPPSAREPSQQPPKESPPEPDYVLPRDDDEYSPEHAPDEVGTGVGEEIYDDDSDLAVTEADREVAASATGEQAMQDKEPAKEPADDETNEKAVS
jgi:sec-independent protein translocase protein TatB